MAEIPDVIREAMAASGVDPNAIAAVLDEGDPVPSDEEALAQQIGRPVLAVEDQLPEERQPSLLDDAVPPVIRYETLLPAADVAVYKRVKRWTMSLGTDARKIIAELVGGTIGDGERSAKEFVQTRHGKFRVCMSHNSDNSTEEAAHTRMGVRTIHLDEPDEVMAFFVMHEIPARPAYDALVRRLVRR